MASNRNTLAWNDPLPLDGQLTDVATESMPADDPILLMFTSGTVVTL